MLLINNVSMPACLRNFVEIVSFDEISITSVSIISQNVSFQMLWLQLKYRHHRILLSNILTYSYK